MPDLPSLDEHLRALREALANLETQLDCVTRWGVELTAQSRRGGRLLIAGNGGSAAHAQHLAAELVGRYVRERPPFAAHALTADSATLTAVMNDYGPELVFERQVRAYGRRGDIFLGISTSGRSPDVLAASRAAREIGMTCWALTGRAPNPLSEIVDECVSVDAPATATVQEIHQIVVHIVCAAYDRELATSS